MISVRHATAPESVETATAAELAERYLVTSLFEDGKVHAVYTHEDRILLAGALPGDSELELPAWPELGTDQPLARRELGVINLGDTGTVTVDGQDHELGHLDGLYAGRGTTVSMRGTGAAFYLVSAPADTTHPTARFSLETARETGLAVDLGDTRTANERRIHRYVGDGAHPSCRLQLGITVLTEGSVWNTMPPHLHDRRTEVYLYTDLAPQDRVVHLLGRPGATRHLLVADRQAVISPAWSVHAGAGTGSYAFIWAMAGENTDYTDLTGVPLDDL